MIPLASASPIKSVQRGNVSGNAFNTSVTLNAVDLNKSFVKLVGLKIDANYSFNARCRLTNPTTLLCEGYGLRTQYISWEVIEYV
jgi:hypothetical protein